MTVRGCGNLFRRARNWALASSLFPAFLALSACGTATIEDAVPQSAAVAAPTAASASASPSQEGPMDTGTYPNLNIAPVAATEQLTPAERAAKTAELQAARARLAGQSGPVSGDPRLRRLAQTHGEEILQEIEQAQ